MKFALKSIIFPLIIGLLTIAGCTPYDDSELSGRVDALEDKVKTLEERINEFQISVDDFTELINQYKNEARIKDFTEVEDGFLLTFADGTSMHIKHGELPELSVSFDEELQEYVWMANGAVVKDTEGKPVAAYIAPEFEVRDGKLGYTLGGEWHEVTNGQTIGLIEDVVSNEEGVTFILSNNEQPIFIPKVGFRLNIDYFEYGASAGQTVNINYSLTDADENAEVLVYPDEGFTVVEQGAALNVTLPAEEEKAYSGKVLVVAVNGNGATSAKVIRFGTLVTEVTSADVIKINRHGGLVPINVRSNRPYSDKVDWSPTSGEELWLIPVKNSMTKAPKEETIYYEAQQMPDDYNKDRQLSIFITWNSNIVNESAVPITKEIIVMQLDTKDVEVDNIMDKDGNSYTYDMYRDGKIEGNGQLEGSLPGGWTFSNCAVNGVNEDLDAHTGELRFVLNGIKDKGGILNSPVLENGIGTLYINYQGHTKNMFQQIKFKIECFKTSDNSLFKDYTVDKKMTEDLQAGEFEFNCSESCKIVITNIATKAPSITTGFANATIFQSMYYTDYKAE